MRGGRLKGKVTQKSTSQELGIECFSPSEASAFTS